MRRFLYILHYVILSVAKNLYDYLRNPLLNLHGNKSNAAQMSLRVTCLLMFAVAASALWITKQVHAQSVIEMQSTTVYQFGEQITFIAQIISPVQIQQANLVIFDEAQAVTHVLAVDFVSGRSEYRFDVRQNLVRPFAVIRWYYELTLTDGSILQSDSYFMRYDDNRFTWQNLEAGSIRVSWVQGDAVFGQTALNAAQSGLQSISSFVPVWARRSVVQGVRYRSPTVVSVSTDVVL